jgi:hypothetical protein
MQKKKNTKQNQFANSKGDYAGMLQRERVLLPNMF